MVFKKMEQSEVQEHDCQFGSIKELQDYAKKHVSSRAYQYFAGAADEGITLRENRKAFERIKILPRYLQNCNCSKIDSSTTILGQKIDFPICASPTGFQKVVHPEGEIATARACSNMNTCLVAGSASSVSFQQIAEAANGVRWMQLDPFKDKALMLPLLEEAKSGHYTAIVLTMDTGSGVQYATGIDLTLDFRNKAPSIKLPNVDLVVSACKEKITNPEIWFYQIEDGSPNWKELTHWIKSVTNLPIILKGVMSVEDAIMATKLNVDGILVSNHGGRSIDNVPSTIEMLPRISEAVGGKLEIYLDSGVRTGSDVFKALALGARAVFLGRPILWGLTYHGQKGVEAVFTLLRDQLKFTMGMTGCAKVSDINKSLVISQHKLSSHL